MYFAEPQGVLVSAVSPGGSSPTLFANDATLLAPFLRRAPPSMLAVEAPLQFTMLANQRSQQPQSLPPQRSGLLRVSPQIPISGIPSTSQVAFLPQITTSVGINDQMPLPNMANSPQFSIPTVETNASRPTTYPRQIEDPDYKTSLIIVSILFPLLIITCLFIIWLNNRKSTPAEHNLGNLKFDDISKRDGPPYAYPPHESAITDLAALQHAKPEHAITVDSLNRYVFTDSQETFQARLNQTQLESLAYVPAGVPILAGEQSIENAYIYPAAIATNALANVDTKSNLSSPSSIRLVESQFVVHSKGDSNTTGEIVMMESLANSAPLPTTLIKEAPERGILTLALIKPDAYATSSCEIIEKIILSRFKIVRQEEMHLSLSMAQEFYSEHKGKPFFESLTNWMSSEPIYVMVLQKSDCVAEWRRLAGPTNSINARKTDPTSIRALFGSDGSKNAVHGSDSDLSAIREIELMFANFFTGKHYDAQPQWDAESDGITVSNQDVFLEVDDEDSIQTIVAPPIPPPRNKSPLVHLKPKLINASATKNLNAEVAPAPTSHVVIHRFSGSTQSDEVNLQVGDLIAITHEFSDGWARAQNVSRMHQQCVVPMCVLKPITGASGIVRNEVLGNQPEWGISDDSSSGGDEQPEILVPQRSVSIEIQPQEMLDTETISIY